mmetsp:Transcript_29805/g.98874  ORF Transcript_29805/g.98874 Transcript_29805/m.98874 type:complete len:230 (-) Transcript_29805:125-814(-)
MELAEAAFDCAVNLWGKAARATRLACRWHAMAALWKAQGWVRGRRWMCRRPNGPRCLGCRVRGGKAAYTAAAASETAVRRPFGVAGGAALDRGGLLAVPKPRGEQPVGLGFHLGVHAPRLGIAVLARRRPRGKGGIGGEERRRPAREAQGRGCARPRVRGEDLRGAASTPPGRRGRPIFGAGAPTQQTSRSTNRTLESVPTPRHAEHILAAAPDIVVITGTTQPQPQQR